MTERRRALLAALEELRVADRILAGIEGAPRTSGQRTWEALRGDYGYASEHARAINSELFDAQGALARARALLGLPPAALLEIPIETEQLMELDEQGVQWTIADDLALVRSLRRDVRALFATLHGEDPEIARTIAPLAEDDPIDDGRELDDDDEEWPASAEPPESYIKVHTAVAALVCFGTGIGTVVAAVAGDVLSVLFGLVAVATAIYVLVTGLAVIQGKRSDVREVLRLHTPLVSLFAAVMAIMLLTKLLSATYLPAGRGRYAPGVLTLSVLHAIRLHGLTGHPPRASLSELGWVAVVVVGLLELVFTLRLLTS